METEHIHEFVILAETCSFQETAAQTFISQSSLTKHIQSIEKELETPLFDRTTRTVKLNQYGAEFYRYAKQIDLISQDYKISMRNMLRQQSGRLSVAFQSRLGQYGIIQLLSRFQEEFPQYPLKIIENNQVVRFLSSGECDFVFSYENTPQDVGIAKIIYRTDNMVVVLPSNHPLAHETHITAAQLQNETLIMHEDTFQNMSWDPHMLQRFYAEINYNPNEVMTTSYSTTLVRMVEQGLGVGLINRIQVGDDLMWYAKNKEAYDGLINRKQAGDDSNENVVFVDISPAIPLHTRLMYHKRIENASSTTAFIEFVKKQGTQNEQQAFFPNRK